MDGSFSDEFNSVLARWKRRKNLVRDRHGIRIQGEPIRTDDEQVEYVWNENKGNYSVKLSPEQFEGKGNKISYKFTVTNDRNKVTVNLVSVELLHPNKMFSITDSNGKLKEGPVELQPKKHYKIVVEFSLPEVVISSFEMPIAFNFQVQSLEKSFTIARDIVIVMSEAITIKNAETVESPFTSNEWPEHVILDKSSDRQMVQMFEVPEKYKACMKENCQERFLRPFVGMSPQDREASFEIANVLKQNQLTPTNYDQYFHFLLWFSETGNSLLLTKFNMENVILRIKDGVLELEVPGLDQKRPSLIKSDRIHIRKHGELEAYEGVIAKIKECIVEIEGVSEKLLRIIKRYPDARYDVRFVKMRLPYERMHQAVDLCFRQETLAVLFPNPEIAQRRKQIQPIDRSKFINKEIWTNLEQRIAVQNIVNGTSMDAPFIVFGPPGTGKTVTIVEAILQTKRRHVGSKILVCASSNDTCDMLALKLAQHCATDELCRIHSENRETDVPKELIPYSNHDGYKYTNMAITCMQKYSIIVTTLILSGRYVGKYSSNFLFIDEAAQAMEPEAACAISLLAPRKGIVLAGDPYQLGPVTNSLFSAQHGLDISLLQRLLANPLYQSGNHRFIVQLRRNFRSHPTILELPNRLFYDGTLFVDEAAAETTRKDPIANVCIYPRIFSPEDMRDGKPVEFCAVNATEKLEGQSPSFFNELEVEMTIKYVEALLSLNKAGVKVEEKDIGIIAPYKRQMYRIIQQLKTKHLTDIEVGTVESFQGREKRVIIICTVRAKQSWLLPDEEYQPGFLRNPKRFNVALTRAKSKLIVVGSPVVLDYDKNWRAYLKFCEELNAYFGIEFGRRPNVIREILKRFQKVQFTDNV